MGKGEWLVLGFIVGFFIGGIGAIETNSVLKEYDKQGKLCEQSLPRDQVCEMKLVVKREE